MNCVINEEHPGANGINLTIFEGVQQLLQVSCRAVFVIRAGGGRRCDLSVRWAGTSVNAACGRVTRVDGTDIPVVTANRRIDATSRRVARIVCTGAAVITVNRRINTARGRSA